MEVSAVVRSDLAAICTTSAIRVTGREMGEEEKKEGKAGKEEVQRLTGRNGEQLNEHQP